MLDPITDCIRARLIATHGPDHPMLDTWTAQARDLYERCQAPHIVSAVAAFAPLDDERRRELGLLLTPVKATAVA